MAISAQEASDYRGLVGRRAQAYAEDEQAETSDLASLEDQEPAETQREKLLRWCNPAQLPNIAEELEEGRGAIGMKVCEFYDLDQASRSEWLEDAKKGMDLALQKRKPKQYPWPGASSVVYPAITQASQQFAARAYPAIIPNNSVVKGKIIGNDEGVPLVDPATKQPIANPQTGQPAWAVEPGTKASRARRIGDHMSWQLLEEQPEWEEDTDKLLNILPIIGCHFRKSYFDPVMKRNRSASVSAINVVINYYAESIYTVPRITEEVKLYPHEVMEHRRSGYFIDQDYGPPDSDAKGNSSGQDTQGPMTFLEQHCRLDLDEDGYEEPYIVTVHKDSYKVARITARFDPEGVLFGEVDEETGEPVLVKIEPVHYYTKYDFLPNTEGGIYGKGFAQFLGPMNEAINSTLNMLIDAGHLANMQGGFIGTGVKMQAGAIRRKPGEWTPVNAPGRDIRQAIVPLEYKEPSNVLFSLLGLLIEASKDISSVKDVLSGEVKAQTMSPTVFLALVEQGLKVFSSIYKRIYRALRDEFDKLYRLNRLYLEDSKRFKVGDEYKEVTRADYERGSGVQPVSDPSMVADAVRIAKSEFLMQFKDDPLCDGIEIRRRTLEAAGIEKIDKILKGQPAPNPEMIAKAAELALKEIEVKAKAMQAMAAAMKSMAEVDTLISEDQRAWAQTQFEIMRTLIDARTAATGEAPGAAGNPGTQPGGMGVVAPSPGDQGVSDLPQRAPPAPANGASGAMGI